MSVDFEPVRIGTRQRRFDPFAVVVVVVVVSLAVAVVKPWEPGPSAVAPGPSEAALVEPSPSVPRASATPRVADPTPGVENNLGSTRGLAPPTWAEVEPLIRPHDGWGVRAILAEQPPDDRGSTAARRYVESWAPTVPAGSGTETAYVAREDASVVGLGITFPSDETPQDVRIWRVHRDDRLEWIDAQKIDSGASDATSLFVRAGVPDSTSRSWQGGHYRIDVLVDGGVRHIALQIPGRLGNVPEPDEWPATERGLVAAHESDPSAVRSGLFATVDGVGVPIATVAGRPLDEVAAWLAMDGWPGGGAAPTVAAAYLPRATGLGVMLTSHAFVHLALLRRLAPGPMSPAAPSRGGISDSQGRTPFVVFGAPDGEAMAPGVYAISVGWTDDMGLHAGTWHVELRPGPIVPRS